MLALRNIEKSEGLRFVMINGNGGETEVSIKEGVFFEINNAIPHRVINDATSWRVHILLDFSEEPVPSSRRFALEPNQECVHHDLESCTVTKMAASR